MKLRRAYLAGVSISALSAFAAVTSAGAEWIYKKEEKAFGEIEAIAMSIGDSSVVFVSCNGEGFKISLATPEDWKETTDSMNLLGPKIILSIDGSQPTHFDVKVGENNLHKILASTDDEETAKRAATMMASAKKRIDIGLELLGERYHASRLSAAGATKKIRSVLDTCAEQDEPEASDEKKTQDEK